MRYRVELTVTPRTGVKDPQAEAVQESLTRLGHHSVTVDGVGRLMLLSVECGSEQEARLTVTDLCDRILVNPSLETFSIEVGERP